MHNWPSKNLAAGLLSLCLKDPHGGTIQGLLMPGPAFGHLCILNHSLAGVLISTWKPEVSWADKNSLWQVAWCLHQGECKRHDDQVQALGQRELMSFSWSGTSDFCWKDRTPYYPSACLPQKALLSRWVWVTIIILGTDFLTVLGRQ
jgi:hypothetical protein